MLFVTAVLICCGVGSASAAVTRFSERRSNNAASARIFMAQSPACFTIGPYSPGLRPGEQPCSLSAGGSQHPSRPEAGAIWLHHTPTAAQKPLSTHHQHEQHEE